LKIIRVNKLLFFVRVILTLTFSIGTSQVNIEEAFPNLNFIQPVDLQYSPDGSDRLFVVEQEGWIYVFENDPVVTNKLLFLDISDRIIFQGERGLLGLAFHPDYENNGTFFVNYTAPSPLRTVISQFQVLSNNPNLADDESEFVIIEINQPFSNHNGGQIVFGPDGYLYIGMGDGGSGGDPYDHGQNLNTLLGSMLRIDVDDPDDGLNYGIPDDNPFVGTDYKDEIFAYGLRNPWRFSFDIVNNNCWIADVGQNLYEEIDILEEGGNFGWNIMEGTHCFNPPSDCDTTGLILPIFEYNHNWGESITGGFVYRGSMVPSIFGKYIFADFEYGDIWSLEYEEGTPPIIETMGDLGAYSVTSFGVDQNNELYICSFDGKIYKFVQSPTSITVGHNTDWNLVGLPLITGASNYQEIFPESILGTLYFFDGGYMSGTDLTNGEGYWLRFPNEGFSIITGIPIYELIINLNEGWNLISGISTILDISEILDPDGIIIPGTLYSFNSGGYFNPETLEPGNGYWIRTNISGTITILVN
jgi:glucose/arabinose dehydrogenase